MINKASNVVIKDCMGVKPHEKVMILCDDNKVVIGEALMDAALSITEHVKFVKIAPGKVNGEEPTREIASLMLECDVLVMATSVSYSHTKARKAATKQGVRIASMPGITEEILIRTMAVDYSIVKKTSDDIASKIKGGKMMRVSSDNGSDISFSILGREVFSGGGFLHEKGAWGNLPSGESCLAPVEGTAEGMFIIDGSILGELVDEPIIVKVSKGKAVSIEGGSTAEKLKKTLDFVGDDAYVLAELGIGTNYGAKVTGNTLEDEKVLGTAHIAFGNNVSYGGSNDVSVHIDGIFFKPTIDVDGKVIVDKGIHLD